MEIELHPSPFYARVIGIFTKKDQTDSFQDQFMTAIEKILQEPRSETYQHMADIASLHNVMKLIQTVLIEDPDIKNVNEGLQRYQLGQEIKDAIKLVTETQITVAMVYAETVRNFRTLAVNIVSVKLYPKSREPGADTELKEMFKDMKTFISEYYTMSRRGTWADKNSVPDTGIFSVERSKALMAKFSKKQTKKMKDRQGVLDREERFNGLRKKHLPNFDSPDFHRFGIPKLCQTRETQVQKEARKDATTEEIESSIVDRSEQSRREGCGRKRSICSVDASSLRIQPESLKIKGGEALFKVYEYGVPDVLYDRKINIYGSDMKATKAYLEIKGKVKSTYATPKFVIPESVSKGMAAYGAIFGTIGSINYFKKGDYVRGGFSLAMSIDNVGQVTGLNTFVRKLVDKVALKSVEEEAGVILRTVGKTAAKLGKLSPVVGFVSSEYFIWEDMRNMIDTIKNNDTSMTAMYAIDLGLDTVSQGLSIAGLAFPPLEPVAFVVSIVRMGVDDLYLDIKEELDRGKGRGAWEKFQAFMKGFEEGLFDFLTAGMGRQMRQLSKQEQFYHEFFRNLSQVDSYFRLSTSADGLTDLDFADGFMSSYGGFITVQLYDNSTFKVRIGNIAASTGQVAKEGVFHASNVTNIILGIGQSVNMVKRGHEDAKLLMLFSTKSYETFSVTGDDSSLNGRYYGNKDDNNFISVQGHYQRGETTDECAYTPLDQDSEHLQVRLQRYYYELYGKRGSDSFHTGPQSSFLNGGEDADTYIFQKYSGSSVIYNFAADQIEDLIHLNVSHHAVQCSRKGNHLNITYCRTHHIQVLNWYSTSKSYQHLTIVTNDGFELKPFDHGFNDDRTHNVVCMPIAIDKSSAVGPQIVDLRISAMNHVSRVVGSNYSDRFYGNDKANT